MTVVDLFRATLISFEALILVLIGAAAVLFPEPFNAGGARILASEYLFHYLPTIPFVLCGFAIRTTFGIRSPSTTEVNRKLYNWPLYDRIVNRVYVIWFYCGLCCVGSIVVWVYSADLGAMGTAILLSSSIGVSAVVFASVVLAAQRLKEILEKVSL